MKQKVVNKHHPVAHAVATKPKDVKKKGGGVLPNLLRSSKNPSLLRTTKNNKDGVKRLTPFKQKLIRPPIARVKVPDGSQNETKISDLTDNDELFRMLQESGGVPVGPPGEVQKTSSDVDFSSLSNASSYRTGPTDGQAKAAPKHKLHRMFDKQTPHLPQPPVQPIVTKPHKKMEPEGGSPNATKKVPKTVMNLDMGLQLTAPTPIKLDPVGIQSLEILPKKVESRDPVAEKTSNPHEQASNVDAPVVDKREKLTAEIAVTTKSKKIPFDKVKALLASSIRDAEGSRPLKDTNALTVKAAAASSAPDDVASEDVATSKGESKEGEADALMKDPREKHKKFAFGKVKALLDRMNPRPVDSRREPQSAESFLTEQRVPTEITDAPGEAVTKRETAPPFNSNLVRGDKVSSPRHASRTQKTASLAPDPSTGEASIKSSQASTPARRSVTSKGESPATVPAIFEAMPVASTNQVPMTMPSRKTVRESSSMKDHTRNDLAVVSTAAQEYAASESEKNLSLVSAFEPVRSLSMSPISGGEGTVLNSSGGPALPKPADQSTVRDAPTSPKIERKIPVDAPESTDGTATDEVLNAPNEVDTPPEDGSATGSNADDKKSQLSLRQRIMQRSFGALASKDTKEPKGETVAKPEADSDDDSTQDGIPAPAAVNTEAMMAALESTLPTRSSPRSRKSSPRRKSRSRSRSPRKLGSKKNPTSPQGPLKESPANAKRSFSNKISSKAEKHKSAKTLQNRSSLRKEGTAMASSPRHASEKPVVPSDGEEGRSLPSEIAVSVGDPISDLDQSLRNFPVKQVVARTPPLSPPRRPQYDDESSHGSHDNADVDRYAPKLSPKKKEVPQVRIPVVEGRSLINSPKGGENANALADSITAADWSIEQMDSGETAEVAVEVMLNSCNQTPVGQMLMKSFGAAKSIDGTTQKSVPGARHDPARNGMGLDNTMGRAFLGKYTTTEKSPNRSIMEKAKVVDAEDARMKENSSAWDLLERIVSPKSPSNIETEKKEKEALARRAAERAAVLAEKSERANRVGLPHVHFEDEKTVEPTPKVANSFFRQFFFPEKESKVVNRDPAGRDPNAVASRKNDSEFDTQKQVASGDVDPFPGDEDIMPSADPPPLKKALETDSREPRSQQLLPTRFENRSAQKSPDAIPLFPVKEIISHDLCSDDGDGSNCSPYDKYQVAEGDASPGPKEQLVSDKAVEGEIDIEVFLHEDNSDEKNSMLDKAAAVDEDKYDLFSDNSFLETSSGEHVAANDKSPYSEAHPTDVDGSDAKIVASRHSSDTSSVPPSDKNKAGVQVSESHDSYSKSPVNGTAHQRAAEEPIKQSEQESLKSETFVPVTQATMTVISSASTLPIVESRVLSSASPSKGMVNMALEGTEQQGNKSKTVVSATIARENRVDGFLSLETVEPESLKSKSDTSALGDGNTRPTHLNNFSGRAWGRMSATSSSEEQPRRFDVLQYLENASDKSPSLDSSLSPEIVRSNLFSVLEEIEEGTAMSRLSVSGRSSGNKPSGLFSSLSELEILGELNTVDRKRGTKSLSHISLGENDKDPEIIDLTAVKSLEDLRDDDAVWLFDVSPKNSSNGSDTQKAPSVVESLLDFVSLRLSMPLSRDEEDSEEQYVSFGGAVGTADQESQTSTPNLSAQNSEKKQASEGIIVVSGIDVVAVPGKRLDQVNSTGSTTAPVTTENRSERYDGSNSSTSREDDNLHSELENTDSEAVFHLGVSESTRSGTTKRAADNEKALHSGPGKTKALLHVDDVSESTRPSTTKYEAADNEMRVHSQESNGTVGTSTVSFVGEEPNDEKRSLVIMEHISKRQDIHQPESYERPDDTPQNGSNVSGSTDQYSKTSTDTFRESAAREPSVTSLGNNTQQRKAPAPEDLFVTELRTQRERKSSGVRDNVRQKPLTLIGRARKPSPEVMFPPDYNDGQKQRDELAASQPFIGRRQLRPTSVLSTESGCGVERTVKRPLTTSSTKTTPSYTKQVQSQNSPFKSNAELEDLNLAQKSDQKSDQPAIEVTIKRDLLDIIFEGAEAMVCSGGASEHSQVADSVKRSVEQRLVVGPSVVPDENSIIQSDPLKLDTVTLDRSARKNSQGRGTCRKDIMDDMFEATESWIDSERNFSNDVFEAEARWTQSVMSSAEEVFEGSWMYPDMGKSSSSTQPPKGRTHRGNNAAPTPEVFLRRYTPTELSICSKNVRKELDSLATQMENCNTKPTFDIVPGHDIVRGNDVVAAKASDASLANSEIAMSTRKVVKEEPSGQVRNDPMNDQAVESAPMRAVREGDEKPVEVEKTDESPEIPTLKSIEGDGSALSLELDANRSSEGGFIDRRHGDASLETLEMNISAETEKDGAMSFENESSDSAFGKDSHDDSLSKHPKGSKKTAMSTNLAVVTSDHKQGDNDPLAVVQSRDLDSASRGSFSSEPSTPVTVHGQDISTSSGSTVHVAVRGEYLLASSESATPITVQGRDLLEQNPTVTVQGTDIFFGHTENNLRNSGTLVVASSSIIGTVTTLEKVEGSDLTNSVKNTLTNSLTSNVSVENVGTKPDRPTSDLAHIESVRTNATRTDKPDPLAARLEPTANDSTIESATSEESSTQLEARQAPSDAESPKTLMLSVQEPQINIADNDDPRELLCRSPTEEIRSVEMAENHTTQTREIRNSLSEPTQAVSPTSGTDEASASCYSRNDEVGPLVEDGQTEVVLLEDEQLLEKIEGGSQSSRWERLFVGHSVDKVDGSRMIPIELDSPPVLILSDVSSLRTEQSAFDAGSKSTGNDTENKKDDPCVVRLSGSTLPEKSKVDDESESTQEPSVSASLQKTAVLSDPSSTTAKRIISKVIFTKTNDPANVSVDKQGPQTKAVTSEKSSTGPTEVSIPDPAGEYSTSRDDEFEDPPGSQVAKTEPSVKPMLVEEEQSDTEASSLILAVTRSEGDSTGPLSPANVAMRSPFNGVGRYTENSKGDERIRNTEKSVSKESTESKASTSDKSPVVPVPVSVTIKKSRKEAGSAPRIRTILERLRGTAKRKKQAGEGSVSASDEEPVDVDELFSRYDDIVKNMVVLDEDRLKRAQNRSRTPEVIDVTGEASTSESSCEVQARSQVSRRMRATKVQFRPPPPRRAARHMEPVYTRSSSASFGSDSSNPSEKARHLRYQLDQALKTSAAIRNTQERLGLELSTFKNKLQQQRRSISPARSVGSSPRSPNHMSSPFSTDEKSDSTKMDMSHISTGRDEGTDTSASLKSAIDKFDRITQTRKSHSSSNPTSPRTQMSSPRTQMTDRVSLMRASELGRFPTDESSRSSSQDQTNAQTASTPEKLVHIPTDESRCSGENQTSQKSNMKELDSSPSQKVPVKTEATSKILHGPNCTGKIYRSETRGAPSNCEYWRAQQSYPPPPFPVSAVTTSIT